MNAAALQLDNVRVHRAGRDILAIDRLDAPPGEFLAVLGRNGAGKTTLLNLCCGLLSPTQGRALLNGRDVHGRGSAAVRQEIGYLPQAAEYNADLPLTVEEVVLLGRTARRGLMRRIRPADRQIAARQIEHLGLEAFRRRTFRTLSGGEQQKTLLARAMAQEPTLLLLDEPGAHLDIDWRRRLTGTIERIYLETRVTVMMVSHDVALIPACCTRVALIHDGQVTATGPPGEVVTAEALSDLYGCPVEVWERDGLRYAAAREPAASTKGAEPSPT
jgi:iron complex transport system ATP-binding protein